MAISNLTRRGRRTSVTFPGRGMPHWLLLLLTIAAPGLILATPAGAASPATRPGEVRENFDNGSPRVRYRTDARGRKNGTYEEFFPDRKTRVRGTYTADQKTGTWTTFDEAGKTLESAAYQKGLLDGPYSWTASGSRRGFRCSYRAGARVGFVTVLNEKGAPQRQVNYPRPLGDVLEAWAALSPKSQGPPKFTTEPALEAPYRAGQIAPTSLDEALKYVQLYRYLSGVPWQGMAIDPSACDKAQHGAVLIHKLGRLDHTPPKPPDMDDAFFKLAYDGCHESNLHQGSLSLFGAIDGFMDDSDESNIKVIGHRRWVLAPGLQKVGFGYADGFTAMHVVGGVTGPPPANFDYAAFPGEGYYPIQLVKKHYAWSVHLNSNKVQGPAAEAVRVKVTRLDEHFQPADDVAAEVISVIPDSDGTVVVVFKPDMKEDLSGKYWVDVSGLRTARGPAPFGYVVDLVDVTAKAEDAPAAEPGKPAAPAPKPD